MSRSNASAYPETAYYDGQPTHMVGGLTIREHFAGIAMGAWVHEYAPMPETYAAIARASVDLADALIAELAKVRP